MKKSKVNKQSAVSKAVQSPVKVSAPPVAPHERDCIEATSKKGNVFRLPKAYLSHTGNIIPFKSEKPDVITFCSLNRVAVNVESQLEGAKLAYDHFRNQYRVLCEMGGLKGVETRRLSVLSGKSGIRWSAAGTAKGMKKDSAAFQLATVRAEKLAARKALADSQKVATKLARAHRPLPAAK